MIVLSFVVQLLLFIVGSSEANIPNYYILYIFVETYSENSYYIQLLNNQYLIADMKFI